MSSMEFLLAVLGTNIFWGVYFLISIIVMIIMLRKFDEEMVNFVIGGDTNFDGEDKFITVLVVIVMLGFWPIILTSIILWYLFGFVFSIIIKGLCILFATIDKIVPNFDIKIKKKS